MNAALMTHFANFVIIMNNNLRHVLSQSIQNSDMSTDNISI